MYVVLMIFPTSPQLHSAKVSLESHDGFEHGVHIQLTKEIWAINGCSEFFQNLNFTLSQTDANSPLVTLSAPAVKLERKVLHFASTSIAAVCGECSSGNAILREFTVHFYFNVCR